MDLGHSSLQHPIIPTNYRITTSESDLAHVSWIVSDLNGRLIWKSTRELVQDEIVESIQDSAGQTQWTIHKPTRGWYLVIRSPVYSDPQNYIALQPITSGSNPSQEVQFSFRLRLSHLLPSPDTGSEACHGTKPELVRHSPSTIKKRSSSVALTPATLPSLSSADSSTISEPLRPSTSPVSELKHADLTLILKSTPAATQHSLLTTIASFFTNQNHPFACTRFPSSSPPLTDPVLFEYIDERSLFGIQSNGTISLHSEPLSRVGLPNSFWVTVCLAYLGFRDDQEAYLAATEDIQ